MLDPIQASEQGRQWLCLGGLLFHIHLYSPDLAPLYHLFGPMKPGLRGKHYENDEEVKSAVKTWLKEQPIQFYEAGICTLVKR
ncbi:histone-lysine N-methyltransferase SETMAR [Elysia marginata]|uniref:Histone-lysine N-methyltransferase SETMAR n=1 Tax=Elysia marginata TaxID=1093978 RepID=A0AAV4HW52_9GAST|nr:histone-lysine N-methyltransferase SETMAR [Elysia marginata]